MYDLLKFSRIKILLLTLICHDVHRPGSESDLLNEDDQSSPQPLLCSLPSLSSISSVPSEIGTSNRSCFSDSEHESNASSQVSEPESTQPRTHQERIHEPKVVSLRWRAFNLNIPELYYLIIGMISSAIIGGITPISCLMVASRIPGFYNPEKQQTRKFISLLGVVSLIMHPLRNYCFAKAGWELTNRIRYKIFEKVSGFRRDGIVSSVYKDAELVKGLIGDDLSFHSQNLGSALTALIITGILNWILAVGTLIVFIVIGPVWYQQSKCLRDSKVCFYIICLSNLC